MTYTKSKQRPKKKRFSTKVIFIVVVVIILAAAGGFWWHHGHETSKKITPIKTSSGTVTPNPSVPSSGNGNNTGTGASASKGEGSTSTPVATPTIQPATPTGEFVSDHHPNLSGAPAPNTETSACTTTPGVKCQITFTSGSVTKSLPAQKTDANGNTIWSNWTLQKIGLTQGTWQVTAVAINGSKTASAQDVMKLVIAQ